MKCDSTRWNNYTGARLVCVCAAARSTTKYKWRWINYRLTYHSKLRKKEHLKMNPGIYLHIVDVRKFCKTFLLSNQLLIDCPLNWLTIWWRWEQSLDDSNFFLRFGAWVGCMIEMKWNKIRKKVVLALVFRFRSNRWPQTF